MGRTTDDIQDRLRDVVNAADAYNGWRVLEVGQVSRQGEVGSLPYGYVRFERLGFPTGIAYGTAMWTDDHRQINFLSGHYDLSYDEAVADYRERR
jgi:hypothetical protein